MAQLVARLVRNEKVRGSNPLSSTHSKSGLTRSNAASASRISAHCAFRLDRACRVPPVCPAAVQTVQSGPVGRGAQVMQVEVRGRDRRVPHPGLHRRRIDAASQPQAGGRVPQVVDPPALARSSAQASVRLNAVACSWWPVSVTNSRSSGSRPAASARTIGSTRSATGTRRDLPDLVPLTAHALRLGPLDDQHRHAAPRRSRAPGSPAARTSAARSSRRAARCRPAVDRARPLAGRPLQLVLAERVHLVARRARPGHPGRRHRIDTIIRSRTAQAKKDDSESRNRFTDDSASPPRDQRDQCPRHLPIGDRARPADCHRGAAPAGGERHQRLYVLADTACWRSSSQIGSKRPHRRPAGTRIDATRQRRLAPV